MDTLIALVTGACAGILFLEFFTRFTSKAAFVRRMLKKTRRQRHNIQEKLRVLEAQQIVSKKGNPDVYRLRQKEEELAINEEVLMAIAENEGIEIPEEEE